MKRVLLVSACLILLTGVAAYSFMDPNGMRTVVAGVVTVFVMAVVFGIAVRFAKSKLGNRVRSALSPLVGAAETYQSMLLGQPTMTETIHDAIRRGALDIYPEDHCADDS
ncbi:hypothetical protein [Arthrobacter cryoconiti]|uniref:Uncharacterized protein n=1 Tax=Arthrobacter cryoconiti TaxID=748907 RepID=A0ABV8R6F3_9MICC|nr:hypothetical protein [Arthrobacter cryoconiti]MCC9066885.1 hypothetical protein [Arthrobacter cryoconiti]